MSIMNCHVFNIHEYSSGGSLEYSEVRIFLEQQTTITTMYKSITTSNNKTIHLSQNHLIYSRKIRTERFNPMQVDQIGLTSILLIFE